MPTFDGQKVACMACIRGHRSSKCNHTDRLMIAVRKPGRPLSSCPHLPGARCGCSNVLAALPRQTNCGCPKSNNDDDDDAKPTKDPGSINGVGPTNGTGIETTSDTDTGSVNGTSAPNGLKTIDSSNDHPTEDKGDLQKVLDSPPLSPAKSFSRVEKKPPRKPSIQKPSFSSAKLERMDSNNINIMPSMTSRNRPGSISMSPVASSVPIPLFENGYEQASNSSFALNGEYHAPSLQPWHSMPNFTANAGNTTGNVPQKSAANGSVERSSCCSGKSNTTHENLISNMGSAFQGVSTQSQPQPQSHPQPQLQQIHVQSSPQPAWNPANFNPRNFSVNGGMLPPNQPMSYSLQNHSSYYSQVAMQPYPPTWGSIAHPLHPAQYQQFLDNSSQAGLQSSYQIPQSPIDLNANGAGAFTTHQCSCGKDCQCIGCPSHPYNDSTQELIWDAMKFQFDEGSSKGQGPTSNIVDIDIEKPATDRAAQLDIMSPAVSNTPSDSASSPEQGESIYQPENYIFVSYPPPPGSIDICPCGPACECIDCVIHRSLDS